MAKPINSMISSKIVWIQFLGAMIKAGWWIIPFTVSLSAYFFVAENIKPFLFFTTVSISLIWLIHSFRILTPLFSLRRQEACITWSQIIILIAFGLWLIATALVFDISKKEELSIPIALIAAILSWIFQDTVKSVAAFCVLRLNDKINIGDWIEVQDLKIDGIIKSITLTSVTIENWDTTTSTFPVHNLWTKSFINNQAMSDGKTHGRRMIQTFLIDTGWFCPLSESKVAEIKEILGDADPYFNDIIQVGRLNAEAFRRYIYYYLSTDKGVSAHPRLMVNWLEHTHDGMILQVYAYLKNTSCESFAWQESQIIEHIIKSMAWFNLKLYQAPSQYDARYRTIHMSEKETNYEIK